MTVVVITKKKGELTLRRVIVDLFFFIEMILAIMS